MLISQVALLEARNVFSRVSGAPHPPQWEHLLDDFDGRIFVGTMNWDALRQETHRLFERFSHKATLGTLDATVVAAVAAAAGLKVFPELGAKGKTLLAELRG